MVMVVGQSPVAHGAPCVQQSKMHSTDSKRLYRLVYRAIKRAASGPVNYWSGKAFASCDPSQWPDDMELSVNVGLGTGNKDQAIQHLALIGTLQEKLIALQGGHADGPYVTPENIANATQKVTETPGLQVARPVLPAARTGFGGASGARTVSRSGRHRCTGADRDRQAGGRGRCRHQAPESPGRHRDCAMEGPALG